MNKRLIMLRKAYLLLEEYRKILEADSHVPENKEQLDKVEALIEEMEDEV